MKLINQVIPPRSVSTKVPGMTPSSSKVISKAKEFGKNPDALPKLASDDYAKTIKDLDKAKNLQKVEQLGTLLGLTGIGLGAAGAISKKNMLRNIGLATATAGGFGHGIFRKKRKNVEYRMKQRHEAYKKGFDKKAALATTAYSGIEAAFPAITSIAPLSHGALATADILLSPAIGEWARKSMKSTVARGLKEQLGYPMTKPEKWVASGTSAITASRDIVKGFAETLARKLNLGGKGTKRLVNVADYPGKVVGILSGQSATEALPAIEPIANIAQQIDPLMTQRLIHAIPEGKEGDIARKALKEVGKKYEQGFKKIQETYNKSENLKKMFNINPGSKERFMADLKDMYDSTLHHTRVGETADKVSAHIKDLDSAAKKIGDLYKKDEKIFNILGTIVRKGKKGQSFSEKLKEGPQAEKIVDSVIGAYESAKRGILATGVGVGAMAGGSILGNAYERALDKTKSFDIRVNSLYNKQQSN